MLIAPWGPIDGEEGGGAITNTAAFYGPYVAGETIRFSSDVDFHYVMCADNSSTPATTSHQVHRVHFMPLDLTIENGYTYISVIRALTTDGTLWSAPIKPGLNKKDNE